MRITINHTAPQAMQPAPADNTGEYVAAQVRAWLASGTLIHTQSALEIAAWWQTPGNAFAPFASTGTIVDRLAEGIGDEIQAYASADEHIGMSVAERRDNVRALRALDAYVRACTVPEVWAVGHNTAGYLPEGDVATFIDYADAVTAYVDMIDEAPDSLAGDASDATGDCSADGPCGIDGGELCDFHAIDAIVKAHRTDDVPAVVSGRVFGTPVELSLSLRPDTDPLPTVYWLARSAEILTYAEYRAESGEPITATPEVRYANLVTAQGDAYREAEAAADAATATDVGDDAFWPGLYRGTVEWIDALFAHLVQWDMGEATEDDVFGTGPTAQDVQREDWAPYTESGMRAVAPVGAYYVLAWDTRQSIASLYRRELPGS